jgi:hypothetical protein
MVPHSTPDHGFTVREAVDPVLAPTVIHINILESITDTITPTYLFEMKESPI